MIRSVAWVDERPWATPWRTGRTRSTGSPTSTPTSREQVGLASVRRHSHARHRPIGTHGTRSLKRDPGSVDSPIIGDRSGSWVIGAFGNNDHQLAAPSTATVASNAPAAFLLSRSTGSC